MNSAGRQLPLARARAASLLNAARRVRILVAGDLMLDQFIWGRVTRISPEAPVPVVEFQRESFMPGGAANVARSLTALGATTELFGVLGEDAPGRQLRSLLTEQNVRCDGVTGSKRRMTTRKIRIIAHQQQVARVDRESNRDLDPATAARLMRSLLRRLPEAHAVIVGDYAKGVVTQEFLDELKHHCKARGLWLSLDPKPVHPLNLVGLSLLTPNRKEAFDLAGLQDSGPRYASPLEDAHLLEVAARLLASIKPALLLITLGEQGMLLCQHGRDPFHIDTVAQEVFDVSGAGDTVIATMTLAIAAGASPIEAAMLANHAAGVVVGKVGTATVTPAELLASFPAAARFAPARIRSQSTRPRR
jgi:D-beta-D-heptose 7-phosphate kinase/D-beta-D-heptose 1-phosphate adenosyltransferase